MEELTTAMKSLSLYEKSTPLLLEENRACGIEELTALMGSLCLSPSKPTPITPPLEDNLCGVLVSNHLYTSTRLDAGTITCLALCIFSGVSIGSLEKFQSFFSSIQEPICASWKKICIFPSQFSQHRFYPHFLLFINHFDPKPGKHMVTTIFKPEKKQLVLKKIFRWNISWRRPVMVNIGINISAVLKVEPNGHIPVLLKQENGNLANENLPLTGMGPAYSCLVSTKSLHPSLKKQRPEEF